MVSEKDGMVMVYVLAGEFEMGGEGGKDDEKPVHAVYLDAYWIDQTEVTNVTYAKCVDTGVCNPPSSTNSNTRDNYYGNSEFDDYPVIYVSWNDVVVYCDWAGRRLPTEAEWEKAARGTDERVYPWGDMIDESYANYSRNIGDTTAVGSYEKGSSFYGAYDMAGNVWEWVSDWYSENYYSTSPLSNPMGPNSGTYRVLRGGTWRSDGNGLRASIRFWNSPSLVDDYYGFRCARDVSP
jgi:formylglycine-generating enzyme required for sulfatase activity